MTETPPPATVIRNADWLIAWDGREHVFMRDADLAFDATGITHVGRRSQGPVENEIDGRSGIVMPGPVNIPCHPTSEPLQRGLTEERKLGMSTIHEYLQLVGRSNNPQILAESKRSDDPHLDVVAERPSRIEPRESNQAGIEMPAPPTAQAGFSERARSLQGTTRLRRIPSFSEMSSKA